MWAPLLLWILQLTIDWDMEEPQEAFLANTKGEVKYWLHDNEALAKVKEYVADAVSTGKSKQRIPTA